MKLTTKEQSVIQEAINILDNSFRRAGVCFTHSQQVKQYCQLNLGNLEHEVFAVMFLNNQHRLIDFQKMFRGTINHAPIFIREIAKTALELNAAAVLLSHNHPSGKVEPSRQDIQATKEIAKALALFNIQVLDHVVVSSTNSYVFSEYGLL